MFPDLELVYGKWEFSFDFNRQHFHIGRVIHHINDPAGKADSQVVFVSTKANAAAFIRFRCSQCRNARARTAESRK